MITKEDLDRVAALVKLNIEESKKSEYIDEIENLLMHIEKIMIADQNATEISQEQGDFLRLREDAAKPSMSREELLLNTDDTEDGFVKLKRRV